MEKNLQSLMTTTKIDQSLVKDIAKAELLSPELMDDLKGLVPELKHNFDTNTIWRTETECRVSVLNDLSFPDKASKYNQCKVEQEVMAEQLLQLSFQFRKLKQDVVIKEAEIAEIDDKLNDVNLKDYEIIKLEAEKEKLLIDIEEKMYGLENMKKQAKHRMREVKVWSRIKSELDDGSFDINDKDTNQLVSFTRSYIQQAWNAFHKDKGTDISSYNNIMAQFTASVKACSERGLLDEVLSYFGNRKEIEEWINLLFNIRK